MLLRLDRASIADRVAALNARYRHHSATAVLEHALKDPELGQVALVSSFGAESVVLLHLVSVIAPETPVIFVDTEMLFTETLVYQQEVAERLGLRDLRIIRAADIATAVNHVNVALAESLAGKAVSTPATRAYGCTIKYGNAGE